MAPSWMFFQVGSDSDDHLGTPSCLSRRTPSHQPDLYYPTTTTSNEFYIESQVDTHVVIQYDDSTLAPAG